MGNIKKVMLVFGTRPEAIKMCPLVKELKKRSELETKVCVTGQHRQMLDSVLHAFSVVPDYDLSIMKQQQTLFDVTVGILERIRDVLDKEKPDVVLVHGDTSTTFVTALACFYMQIPVGHVEAGLRTYNIYSPYPEEFNRQAVGIIAKYNFAPTELAKQNLLNEGKSENSIYVTGNTAIDALATTVREDYTHPVIEWAEGSRLIVITAHRRENLGEPMHHMFRAIRRIIDQHEDAETSAYNFYPDKQVSRGDFLAMALICAGKESQIEFVDKTSFDDDELIPVNIKSYVEYARTNGIVNGYTLDNGQTVFASSDPISRAEAAVIVDRILSLPDNDTVITGQFDDCASVESWAGQALANLNAIGIFKGNGYGEMLPDNNVTRAETAEILCSICDYSTETVSSAQKSKPSILNLFGLLGD